MSNQNDIFDEFQFKPLTEGLGFHKRETSTSPETQSEDVISFASANSISTRPASNSTSTPASKTEASTTTNSQISKGLQSPLPRPTQNHGLEIATTSTTVIQPRINIPLIEDDSISKAQSAVNEILKNLNHKQQQDELHARTQKKMVWRNTAPSILAASLDFMLITSGFLTLLIAMLAITKVDLIANVSNPGSGQIVWLATGALFAVVTLVYMTTCRMYFGFTAGEWAFDQRCGTEAQQASIWYVAQVLLRTTLIIITGYVPLALISKIIRLDLFAYISGVQIQKKIYV